jgi:hypothetical protein
VNINLDPSILILAGLGVFILLAGSLMTILAIKIARMKVQKEVGLLKRHMAYKPAPPKKQYTINEQSSARPDIPHTP